MKKNKGTDQMTLTGTEEGEILARLGERVEKAIVMITELRRERDALRERLTKAEALLEEQNHASERLTTLEEEHERFTMERGEIRSRIETILSSLESLDAPEE